MGGSVNRDAIHLDDVTDLDPVDLLIFGRHSDLPVSPLPFGRRATTTGPVEGEGPSHRDVSDWLTDGGRCLQVTPKLGFARSLSNFGG